jgi:ABC-2 type transport system ATP-binding protein
MTNTDLVIDVRNVTKRFAEKTVVDSLSMQVKKGEIYGFLGPNGSGKTTFIRMICGLLRADAGEGTCLGLNFRTQSDEIKCQVGYMTQKFSLYEDLSLEENLDFIASIYGMEDHQPAVAKCLEDLGLTDRKHQLAGQLSGGWKQRLALAACLLHRPRLLLLDEPTAGVDPKARRDFWLEIHRLAHQGMTILVTTHYMDEAEQCDRLAYIAYGHLLANGTVKEVIASAGLTTYRVTGHRIEAGVDAIRSSPGVGQVVPFGRALHVSGRDAATLDLTAQRLGSPDQKWDRVEPGLEDVFIALMDTSKDNFRND